MTQILKYAVNDDEKQNKFRRKCIFGCQKVPLLLFGFAAVGLICRLIVVDGGDVILLLLLLLLLVVIVLLLLLLLFGCCCWWW